MNAQADIDADTGVFSGFADFSKQFDLVNGRFTVALVAADSSSAKVETWDLGTLNVWFKEGQVENNNQYLNKNYFPKESVIAQFPPT